MLLQAGWRPDDVEKALKRYVEIDFPVPVPAPEPYLSARDAFMHLVLFVTLYISAYSMGSLLFDLIGLWLPDPVTQQYAYEDPNEGIRRSVASIIIAFPIYMFLSRTLVRAYRVDPDRRQSRVRKWLTYVTLFIAAFVIIGDLIALVTSLLGGEITLRFILKVLVVGLIAGLIFGYYLWDLRRDEREV